MNQTGIFWIGRERGGVRGVTGKTNHDGVTSLEIEIRGLVKSFGTLPVLRGIDLDVATGEVVVVIGPSGSGKSTLLNCINFLEPFQEGTVRVSGKSVGYNIDPTTGIRVRQPERELNVLRTGIGMVFQHFNLFPHMTALGNIIEAPVYVRGEERETAIARARNLLARVGLMNKENAYPAELSGGQKQRVAIARSLAMEPKVMRIDARSQRGRKNKGGAIGAYHICLKCNADLVQRAPQTAACPFTIRLRPQQACHKVTANRPTNISNIGEQS